MAIIDNVVGQLKAERPEINQVCLRQDNAGCYHNAFNLLAMKELAKDTKSHLEGIFQTPKVEKGHLTEKQPQSRTMSKHT